MNKKKKVSKFDKMRYKYDNITTKDHKEVHVSNSVKKQYRKQFEKMVKKGVEFL